MPRIGDPDPWMPGARSLLYALFCWFNRHPEVLRAIGALSRWWTYLPRTFGYVARRRSVVGVLTRPNDFSNASHMPNLFAGPFLIGADPGPGYAADKALFHASLTRLNVRADADREAQALVNKLSGAGSFDLVEDYLMWVVFGAIAPGFGAAAAAIAGTDREEQRRYLHECKYVAGQLFAGALAPTRVQRRAQLCAQSLRTRVQAELPALRTAWAPALGANLDARLLRTGIGYAWVSHPVTVQSGALLVQELLRRPGVYRQLREFAMRCGPNECWNSADLRASVRRHVIELMRFRPVFTIIARDVPRETEFEAGGRRTGVCPAGGSMKVLTVAAQFDTTEVPDARRFRPDRAWGAQASTRYLMFGYGSRQCPARDQSVDMLTSALIGLLQLPELRLADRIGRRIRYDGPLISSMRLAPA